MWQPIETAPKDGTEVLGWDGVNRFTCRYKKWGNWDLLVCGSYAGDGDCFPTHWMPLPSPPKDDSI
ncbi:DUF551 domain-containing protein [Dyadobacter sp. CY261]|uniref:DUF551 domain-containing protein n=1 Tax=Dyadobacter sp. CY261 TaxID=2907203 RepID=UPI0038D3CF5A